jgi:hypothetical protein
VRITTIAVVIGLVLIAFVGVETPIAHGLDFMRLQNGTQVPNSLGIGLHMLGNNSTYSTYQNNTYGIRVQYPSDWSMQELKSSGERINVAAFVSPTGPDSDPTGDVSIYIDKLQNSTTDLNGYAHFVAFADYENKTSYM